jgi:Uma2 family endonuclease
MQKILASSDAPTQIETLQKMMEAEKKRRHEFREWVTPNVKAEFINGEVILHSPVKRKHWKVTDLLSSLLSFYARIKKLGVIGTEKVMISLTRNDYEPDLVFFKREKAVNFTDEQMLFPAPNFVVEILSAKTASKDKGIKKQDYAAHGIEEYWIIDPTKKHIEQYILLNDKDKQYTPTKIYLYDDLIESKAIEGFNIPVKAIFDEEENIKALQILLEK